MLKRKLGILNQENCGKIKTRSQNGINQHITSF